MPRLRIAVPLDSSRLNRVRERLRDYLEEFCADQRQVDEMVLSIDEACANAIRHSRSTDDLEIDAHVDADTVYVRIKDAGIGFDVEGWEPRLPDDPLADHGRGLYLMSCLCDELELCRDHGLEVRLAKRVTRRAAQLGPVADMPLHYEQLDPERLRLLFEEIPDGYAALDWEYRYTYINARAEAMGDVRREDVFGRTLWEVFPDIVGTPVERHLRDAMELGVSSRYEFFFPPLNGWFEQRVYPTRSGIGQYTIDITDRKRGEAERDEYLRQLLESEERFRVTFEQASVGMVHVGPDLKFVRANDAFCRFVGYSREELLELTFLDVTYPDDLNADLDLVRELLADEIDSYSMDKRIVRKDGSVVWGALGVALLRDEQGEPLYAIAIVQDITVQMERQRLSEALNEIATSITTLLVHDEILDTVVAQVGAALAADSAVISALCGDALVPRYLWRAPEQYRNVPVPLARTPFVSRAIERGGVVAIDDTLHDGAADPDLQRDWDVRSVAVAPLVVRGETTGALFVNYHGAKHLFTPAEEDFVGKAAAIVSSALETARLYEAERRRLERLEALHDVAELGVSSLEPREVAQHATAFAVSRLDVDAAALFVMNERGDRLHPLAVSGLPKAFFADFADGIALDQSYEVARASDTGKVIVCRDVATCGLPASTLQVFTSYGMPPGAYLVAPLRTSAGVIGAVSLLWRAPQKLDHDDVAFLTSFVNELGLALHNARLLERERASARLAGVLAEIDRAVHSSLLPDEILRWSLDRGTRALGVAAGTIERRDRRSWVISHQCGFDDDLIGLRLSDHEAPNSALVLRTGEPVALADAQLDPVRGVGFVRTYGMRSLLGIPLHVHGQVTGCLFFYDRAPHAFVGAEIEFARKLGDSVSIALENARLYEEVQESERRFRATFDQAAVGMAHLTSEGRFLRVNDRFCRLTGYSRHRLLGMDDLELTAPEDRAADTEQFRALVVGDIDTYRMDKRYVRPDGKLIWVSMTRSAVRSGGVPDYLVSVVQDASARKQAEEQRERALAELRARGKEVRARTDELQARSEELQIQSAELQGQRDELAERARLADALDRIGRLIHSTLDTHLVMQRVVDTAAEALRVKAAVIELRDGDDWPIRYLAGLPRSFVGSSLTEEPLVARRVLRERGTIVVADAAADPAVALTARRLGIRALLAAPLVGQNEVFGVLIFLAFKRKRVFGPGDIDFANRLASSVSLALENARLYEEQRSIATRLQENLLHPLPSVDGLELGSVSEPAFAPELVGGDFYDVFELFDGRVAMLIGDVMGKGVEAAGLTETVRSTVHALASVDPGPSFVLAKANELLLTYESDALVTVVLLVLDPATGRLTYASAGHPPPLHVHGRRARPLPLAFGLPLGSVPDEFAECEATLGHGDALVLYTDGVTEARRRGELFGERRLRRAVLSLASTSPQELATGLRDAAMRFADELRDDLQVLVVRRI